MAYTIEVQSTQRIAADTARAVAQAANETLAQEAADEGAALTIMLTDDYQLRELNRQFRGEDKTTDVLSFPAGDPMPGIPEAAGYLGDIAISIPQAEKQALDQGHPTQAELQLLTVHGVLHLLGHDHDDLAEKETMWAAQSAVLRKLGLSEIRLTEDDHGEG